MANNSGPKDWPTKIKREIHWQAFRRLGNLPDKIDHFVVRETPISYEEKTFNRFKAPDPAVGQIFVLFIMGLAAAEIAIALSIIIAVYRNYRSVKTKELSELNG